MTTSKVTELIAMAREAATIVPLSELHDRWTRGLPHAGLVAITFDDAYESLLKTATAWYTEAPFPITVFVVSDASKAGCSYWWDRIEAIAPFASLSDRIALEAAAGVPERLRGRTDPLFGPWRVVRQWMLQHHAGRAPEGLWAQLAAIEGRVGAATAQRAMTIEELHAFGRLGPVSFGVHTATHPVLPLLADDRVVAEIQQAWHSLLEWELPAPTPYLAAPFGLYDMRTATLASGAGMHGVVGLQESVLVPDLAGVMPRWSLVSAMTGEALAMRLSGAHGLLKPRTRRGPPEVS